MPDPVALLAGLDRDAPECEWWVEPHPEGGCVVTALLERRGKLAWHEEWVRGNPAPNSQPFYDPAIIARGFVSKLRAKLREGA